jgi:hypothetical protein
MSMITACARDRKRIGLPGVVSSLLCFGLWLPTEAFAQPPLVRNDYAQRAAAEALFDEAKSLMTARRFTEACPKFAASQAMDPAVGTRLNLADCLEQLGHTASAWAEFRAAAAAARAKGQFERAEVARKRAAALERVLVRLSVVPPLGSNDAVEIRKNGAILERGSWGVALPVDPGRYVVDASISGNRAFRTEVDVPNKPGTVVTTVIPTLEDSAYSRREVQRGFAIATGAVSLVSFVAGGVLGARAIGQNTESTTHCNRKNVCDETGLALRRDAETLGNASTAAFIIGATAGVGAIVLHLTTPKIPPTNIGFGAMHSGVGLIVGGAF